LGQFLVETNDGLQAAVSIRQVVFQAREASSLVAKQDERPRQGEHEYSDENP